MSFINQELLSEIQDMKFFIYLRKSSEDNEDKQLRSIDGQFDDITSEIVNRYNLKNNVLHIYKEEKSAFKVGRVYFNEMMDRIEAGEASGIITWHANRLGRNYQDAGRFVQLMSDGKIKMVLSCQ